MSDANTHSDRSISVAGPERPAPKAQGAGGMSDDMTLAGWHKDPSGRHELRFWDGDRWTEHVVDEGIPGLDHPTRSGRATTAARLSRRCFMIACR